MKLKTHTSVCLFVNIVTTIIFKNSLILFSHETLYVSLSIYSLSSCPKKIFSSQQKYFNLMIIIHIGIVCLLLVVVYQPVKLRN